MEDLEDSVFTKIIRGDIPGEIIYQDDDCYVLLTIEPISAGHMLVIPREQIDHLWDVSTPLYSHLMDVAKRMAEALRTAYAYKRIGMLVEGFGVPHAHVHILGIDSGYETLIPEHIAHRSHPSSEELHAVANTIRATLK